VDHTSAGGRLGGLVGDHVYAGELDADGETVEAEYRVAGRGSPVVRVLAALPLKSAA
jgi:hypothetical protein